MTKLNRDLSKSFEPSAFEDEIYNFWESSGFFRASDKNKPGQKSYSIVLPPPNVTGVLHIGHALTNTIQDTLIRWRRMSGDNTLWLPGTDHAGIATQTQVENAIAKEMKNGQGKPMSRHDLGRKKFLERTWQWKEDHHGRIVDQMRSIGSSLDWDRERFTMDEGSSRAVVEAFVRLYEEKLIYRGERIINWCPRCQTALSDLEVTPKERKSSIWHIRYPIVEKDGSPVVGKDGKPASVVIATTRPETLLGDTAIAFHPKDERYRGYHNKFAKLPLLGRVIPVIIDHYVDKEFGTGALKVTPSHDFNDYDLGLKHNLPSISVIGKDGKITKEGGNYLGLPTNKAREKVIEDLVSSNQLVKTEDHLNKVGLCSRCNYVAEPLMSKQWFVKIKPLADPAIKAVELGKTEFVPKSWEKTYFEWMYNIRDWCISRQLWWGHQIPAWYCKQCDVVTVSRDTPVQCSGCKSTNIVQDEDVLDTWFSSGLWPISTLGWPDKTPALNTFYPTSVLETGFDIIFFWVARMMMMGIHFMGEVPFKKVYLHAMVRDEKGEKMSKTKGNVIDPLEWTKKYGSDSLRFTFAVMAGQGRDIKLSESRVEGYQAFCNKIWNAVKFLKMNWESAGLSEIKFEELEKNLIAKQDQLLPANAWILSRLQEVIQTSEAGFEKFEINLSAQSIYDFTWRELCDWAIEFSKIPLNQGSENLERRKETLYVLCYALDQVLKISHPIMPFVTEKLWQALPLEQEEGDSIMISKYPGYHKELQDSKSEHTIETVKNLINSIRNFRGENRVDAKKKFDVRFVPASKEVSLLVKDYLEEIQALAKITSLTEIDTNALVAAKDAIVPVSNPALELRISLDGLVDVEGETKRLSKEIAKVEKDIDHIQRKLSNKKFTERAPAELVEKETGRKSELESTLKDLSKAIERLKS